MDKADCGTTFSNYHTNLESVVDAREDPPASLDMENADQKEHGSPSRNQTWKNSLKQKQHYYLENFSMHGLANACLGRSYERVLWVIAVLLTTFGVFFGSSKFVNDFMAKDVRTEIRYEAVDELPLPAITVCSLLLTRHGYMTCLDSQPIAPIPDFMENMTVCPLSRNTSLFNMTFAYYQSDIETRETTKTCRTFNPNGTLKQKYSGIPLVLTITSNIYEIDEFQFFFVDKPFNHTGMPSLEIRNGQRYRPGEYKVYLERREFERKQYPFPSNCSNGENEEYFSRKYTRISCYESCMARKMYEKCGTLLDWWKPYAKQSWKFPGVKKSKFEQKQCVANLQKQIRLSAQNMSCDCPLACKDVLYTTSFFRSYNVEPFNVLGYHLWKFEISYMSLYNITITEEELYSMKSLFADIGAVLGLLSGTSLLSVLEIIVCLGLTVALHCRR